MRDEFWAFEWLLQFRSDPLTMAAMREFAGGTAILWLRRDLLNEVLPRDIARKPALAFTENHGFTGIPANPRPPAKFFLIFFCKMLDKKI